MRNQIIFETLPETFPGSDEYKWTSFIAAVLVHVGLAAVFMIIPFFVVDSIPQFALLTELVAPPPPPPAAPPVPVARIGAAQPVVKPAFKTEPAPDVMISPVTIPQEIARFTDEPIISEGGVVGGDLGGVVGGVVGGMLARNALIAESGVLPLPAPLPPPPPLNAVRPALAQPFRVGGDVREPRLIERASLVYPTVAAQARVQGLVVLEAVVKEDGTVDKLEVISGHPSLVDAAVNCVKKWRYEPTLLNGLPVPVVLTVRITFQLTPHSD